METPDGCVCRRNHRHVVEIPSSMKKKNQQQKWLVEKSPTIESEEKSTSVNIPKGLVFRTRSGRIVKKPMRFSEYVVIGDSK